MRSGKRAVAQFGSAPAWGAGGRRFESCQPDHFLRNLASESHGLWDLMIARHGMTEPLLQSGASIRKSTCGSIALFQVQSPRASSCSENKENKV